MPLAVVRVFKSWATRDAERRWANTYEVDMANPLSPETCSALIGVIVNAEQALHLPQVNFLSATVSTWQEDSTPYNPAAFFTQELSQIGTRVPQGDPLDSNICFVVRKQTGMGRSGRLFYRGVLTEGDCKVGGDGRFALTENPALTQAGTDFTTYRTRIAQILAGVDNNPAVGTMVVVSTAIVTGSGEVSNARAVMGVVVGGVTVNKRRHRYFDRAAA